MLFREFWTLQPIEFLILGVRILPLKSIFATDPFMVVRFEALPAHLHVQPVASSRDVSIGRLQVEADELCTSHFKIGSAHAKLGA
jgi:hypothetical protein